MRFVGHSLLYTSYTIPHVMETTRLSGKGHVVIPEAVRQAHQWKAGQEFEVMETDEGILLKPVKPFPPTQLADVAGSLAYEGTPKTLNDMEDAIANGVTRDDADQFERAHSLFAEHEIFLPETVLLETEWVLRYAYGYDPAAVVTSLQKLLGLSNVNVRAPQKLDQALRCHANGLDFADALHLAGSQHTEAFVTFDRSLIRSGASVSPCPVKQP